MATLMYQEATSAPQRVADLLQKNKDQTEAIGEKLRRLDPAGGVTVARGSSNHAASYFSCLTMQRTGLPVTALPLSLTTLFNTPWKLSRHFALAISQSGKSTDLVKNFEALKHGGTHTIALINAPDSPLEAASHETIALHSGAEKSVAATKSYITSLAAATQLLAAWLQDKNLQNALQALPDVLEKACTMNWQKAVDVLKNQERMFVISRGASLAIAQEAALKFKETCNLQAEAFSSAEVKHGPMALVGENYPVLIFAPAGAEQAGLLALAKEFRARKARVLLAADESVAERDLDIVSAADSALSPVSVIQSFYIMVEQLARARGLHPDTPRFLNKVTDTV